MTDRSGQDSAGLLRRISIVTLGLTALGTAVGLLWNAPTSVGIAAGGLLGLALLHGQRLMVASITRAACQGGHRPLLFWIYLLRWPAIAAAFYLPLAAGWVSPIGLCIGITLLPAAITVVSILTARSRAS